METVKIVDAHRHGVLVRYCDDLVVMCVTWQQAEAALVRLTELVARLRHQTGAAIPGPHGPDHP